MDNPYYFTSCAFTSYMPVKSGSDSTRFLFCFIFCLFVCGDHYFQNVLWTVKIAVLLISHEDRDSALDPAHRGFAVTCHMSHVSSSDEQVEPQTL